MSPQELITKIVFLSRKEDVQEYIDDIQVTLAEDTALSSIEIIKARTFFSTLNFLHNERIVIIDDVPQSRPTVLKLATRYNAIHLTLDEYLRLSPERFRSLLTVTRPNN